MQKKEERVAVMGRVEKMIGYQTRETRNVIQHIQKEKDKKL